MSWSLSSHLIYYNADILAMSMITCVLVKTKYFIMNVKIISQNVINSLTTSWSKNNGDGIIHYKSTFIQTIPVCEDGVLSLIHI